jgi:F0F1-type ATP synthase assembly protein I
MIMATTPDNLPIAQTHASRPSKLMILLLVGIVIGFFAITMSQDMTAENQPAATSSAPSRE